MNEFTAGHLVLVVLVSVFFGGAISLLFARIMMILLGIKFYKEEN